jgi:hypothetical protein
MSPSTNPSNVVAVHSTVSTKMSFPLYSHFVRIPMLSIFYPSDATCPIRFLIRNTHNYISELELCHLSHIPVKIFPSHLRLRLPGSCREKWEASRQWGSGLETMDGWDTWDTWKDGHGKEVALIGIYDHEMIAVYIYTI